MEYLFKHILIFRCLVVGWPIVKGIRRLTSNPIRNVAPPVQSFDGKSNTATSGAPSEVGDEDFTIPKCKSEFVAKLQYSAEILGPTCTNETAKTRSLMKFDGCTAPPHAMRYLNGATQMGLRDPRSRLYDTRVRSVKCFVPQCPEAGFQSHVGNETKSECLTHMKQRIDANLDRKSTPGVDLSEKEMPPLTQMHQSTPVRKLSAGPADSFDFSEIDRMVNRIGGKRFAPDATTGHHRRQDSEIWKGVNGATHTASPSGYEFHRAPVAETVTWDGSTGSDTGYSVRDRRRSDDLGQGVRLNPHRNRQQEGHGDGGIFSDDDDDDDEGGGTSR